MRSENKRYFKLGITIFASLSGTVAFFFLMFRLQEIKDFFSTVILALQPILIGIVLAYLLNPVAEILERALRKIKITRPARVISVILTLIFALGIVVLCCAFVLPQLVQSVASLVNDLPELLNTQLERIGNYISSYGNSDDVMKIISSVENFLLSWIQNNLFSMISAVANSVYSIGTALVNIIIAIIVTIYLLLDKERYLAQCRKLFNAVCKNQSANEAVSDVVQQTDRIFSGFISGKLLDSLIVGVICFIFLLIFKMPYAPLISVIIGVTNIIPMFGPFIGAIPSAFLILLISPMKCLIFLIFIIILQLIDGNVIGPRILGNSTGLSALYVTVAMLLFGKLLGFTGMIIGVPLFATLYYIVKKLAENSLKKRNLPVSTSEYVPKKRNNFKRGRRKKTKNRRQQ